MAIFWDDDFEGASGTTIPDWTYSFGANALVEATTTQPFTGSVGIQANFVSVSPPGGAAVNIQRLITSSDTIFFRAYIRASSGFVTGDNGASKCIEFRTPNSEQIIYLEAISTTPGSGVPGAWGLYYQNPYGSCAFGNRYNYFSAFPVASAWQLFEMQITMNTPGQSDGLVKVWIDSTGGDTGLTFSATGLALRGPTTGSVSSCNGAVTPSTLQFSRVWLMQQSGVGVVYYDRVAVGDTRILAVGASPDTTPPAIPTGVMVS